MKIEVTTDIAIKHLRSDIVDALGYSAIDAIINHYDNQDPNMIFDPSIFAEFDKYDDLEAAIKKIYPEAHREILQKMIDEFDGEISWNDAHEAFLEYFQEHGRVAILLDDDDIYGEVLISQH